ncbi:MAG: hypothetical protein ABI234_02045 [Ktedonobacteraceae bacterium]
MPFWQNKQVILVLGALGDVIWSIHLTAGTIVFTGVAGWVLIYLILPGHSPEVFRE